MTHRAIKDVLYAQVARIGQAVSSPKRLELIELLCQGEKSVEILAGEAEISVKLASAHLKALRQAHLVDARRAGKRMVYRLTDTGVADFWVALRELAEERLLSLRVALADMARFPDELAPMEPGDLLQKAARGEVVVIDLRPEEEFQASHLPHAHSMPIAELQRRLQELPLDKPVVAYCRGPFCLWGKDAVSLLRAHGIQASRLADGVAEWRAWGLPLSKDEAPSIETMPGMETQGTEGGLP